MVLVFREDFVVGCEGVMEMGDSSDVPRVTCHGARQEAVRVVNEVGDDNFDDILWELGDWRRRCGRCLRSTSRGQPSNSGYCSVPKLVNKQLGRYRRHADYTCRKEAAYGSTC